LQASQLPPQTALQQKPSMQFNDTHSRHGGDLQSKAGLQGDGGLVCFCAWQVPPAAQK
jgi:hypothetical protein